VEDLVESTSKDGPKHLLSERARGKLADLEMTEFFAGTFWLTFDTAMRACDDTITYSPIRCFTVTA